MKKTGELLKNKREAATLSISEVALATKINPKILNAIEAGDEANLPAKTFLKGFVRSYALHLRLDVDEVMRTFIEETGAAPPTEAYPKPDANSPRGAVNEESSAGLRTAAIVVIVLLIGLIIGVRELVDKYQREKVAASQPSDVKVSPLPTETPVAVVTAETKTAEAKADAAKPAEPEAHATPAAPKVAEVAPKPVDEAKPVEVKPLPEIRLTETAPSERVSLAPALFGIPKALEAPVELAWPAGGHAPASTQPPTAEPSEPVVAKAEAPKAEAPKDEPKPEVAADAPAAAVKNEVIIEALDRVEVKFQLAGETKTVALAPNDVHVIRAAGAVTMDFSDGGAVNLVHNGRVHGTPGKLGDRAQVKYP